MPRSFIPRPDDKRVTWLNAYADGLGLSIGQAGITAGDAARARADADYFAAIVSWKAEVHQASENVTAYVDQIANGLPPGIDPNVSPVAPPMPVYPADAPPAVPWDVIGRASKSAARIKIAPGYTPALGRLLGIIAATPEPRPVQDLQPDLKVPGLNAGHPMLRWVRGDMEMTEVQADHADGKGWVQITKTTRSEMTDPFPLPAPGAAQVWRYRAIFHDATGPIGQWSDVVQVTVAGA